MTIKAINVRNQFKGTIKEIVEGDVLSEIDVQTASGIVTSVITTRSVKELELAVGSEVIAFVKSKYASILDTIETSGNLDDATEKALTAAVEDFKAQADPNADSTGLQARYAKTNISNFDGQAALTEMDALIAYLQVLGTMVDFSTFTPDASR